MSNGKQFFGTDGIRGRVGQSPMTADQILRLGWAAGRVLGVDGGKVLIGKDTRISGYMFESALEAGFSAAGMNIRLLGPMPTPAIAYLTLTFRAKAGVVISASHNPYHDNGVKFFGPDGGKLSDEIELAIEAEMAKPFETVSSEQLGKAERIDDAPGRYIEHCKSAFPGKLDLNGVKLVVDCSNGSGYHIAPPVFKELGADITVIGASPDGLNINQGCGSTKPEVLSQSVLAANADVGIALDGDGDRVVMVDHLGGVADGDELIYIIARERQERGKLRGPVVGTIMTNYGMELALKKLGIAMLRSDVGDRHVLEALKANGGIVGGEPSGHILCLDRGTTGDGIVAALQVLAVMRRTGKSLYELRHGMRKLPQTMINVPTDGDSGRVSAPEVQAAVAEVEKQLNGEGRVVLRPSGTEPLIRVMVEASETTIAERAAQHIADAVEKLAA